MPETRIFNEESLGALACQLDQLSDGIVRVLANGELDLATAPALERALDDAHAAGRLVVLDLRGVSFCDSTGLHTLIRANQRAREEGRRLVIVKGPQQVQRLFALTGVDAQLEIIEDAAMIGGDAEPNIAAHR